MKLHFTDAFSARALRGNPAPVVCGADRLSDTDKQRLARELNASETVFVSDSDVADFRVQFFTPRQEIALCGHGTVGAFWVLASIGRVGATHPVARVTQETRAGILPVDIHFSPSGTVQKIMMHQVRPTFHYPSQDRVLIAAILGIQPGDILDELPVLNVSTGREKLMVPVRNQQALYDINPDYARMAQLCLDMETHGFHVFTFDTRHSESITTARHFAPTAGVNEDIVTGSAAGALGCYLVKHYPHLAPDQTSYRFVMEQGHNFDREGRVLVAIEQQHDEISSVQVGGTAVILFETPLSLDEAVRD
jgi:trans-2,3-dihydro-3-hydroxyanthranilate isomerase